MHYSILGTTRALRDDGTAAALGGARLRALLTVLALRPGRTVTAGVLVDEVWDGDPPADAPGALQALVGRLRRALGRDAVDSVDNGYRLAAAPDAVDLYRFERLAGEGARALEEGDAGRAAGVLDDALALWRGPVLADLPDRAVAAARWEARRLDARRTRITASLALGRAVDALPELAALCADHPIDEPLQALRIRALRGAGRPAQALEAYEEARTLLADRLGTAPGPELRKLYEELLHQDPAPPDPAPARTLHGNLRSRLTSFVGRETDIAALREDLSRSRLITLLGPGGAGKTRLSQEAAEAVAASWPDGVWLAELAPVDDPAAVADAVLSALGARETVLRGAGAEGIRAVERAAERGSDRPASAVVQLTEHCSGRRMLLLLDNCEHVIEAAAELTDHLLAHCPGLTVLATSREPLGVPGELLHPVDPLPDPMALRLLADRGAAARPGFRVDADGETAAACAEICHRLDGLPLAIELAAARLRMLGPRQIADRLDDRFRLLTSGSRTLLPRQQTLRAVVDWSWDLLDAAERAVLRRLSVFAGGCGLTAAEEVCSVAGVDARDVAALLGSLVDKSLVVAVPDSEDGMRYRLLETVTEYASDRLDEAGERSAVERRHLVHYRELARLTDPLLRGAGQLDAIALFQREYENLRTALRRAEAAQDEHELLCLVLSLGWYWAMRDLRTDARHWADAAARLGPDPFAEPVEPAPSLLERCTDRPPPMEPEQLKEARRGARLIQLVNMDHSGDEWASEAGRQRLKVIARTYKVGQPQTCRPPGSLWLFAVLFTGKAERLRELMDETVRACREFGYQWELAAALQMRANVLANHPDRVDRARGDADESLDIFVRVGDAWGAAEALSSRGRPMSVPASSPLRPRTSVPRSPMPSSSEPSPRSRCCAPGTPPPSARTAGARRGSASCAKCWPRAGRPGTRRGPPPGSTSSRGWGGPAVRARHVSTSPPCARSSARRRWRSSRGSCWACWPGWTTSTAGTPTVWTGPSARWCSRGDRCRRWWHPRCRPCTWPSSPGRSAGSAASGGAGTRRGCSACTRPCSRTATCRRARSGRAAPARRRPSAGASRTTPTSTPRAPRAAASRWTRPPP